MAVQVAPAQARDFIETMAAENGGTASPAGKTADGKAARESFDGILAGARLAKSMYAARYGMSDEVSSAAGKIENFAGSLSDEDLSLLIAPISNGVEQMRDFADALDAELSEGDVRGAIALAGQAVEKVSRFDPDLILGDLAGGSLHKLIKEFLEKFGAGQAAKQEPGIPAEPAWTEIPVEPFVDGDGVLPSDLADDTEVLPDGAGTPAGQEIPDLPELPADALPDAEAEPKEERDTAETDTEIEAETNDAPQDRIVLNAAFAEMLTASRGKADEKPVEPDLAAKADLARKPDGEGLTPKRANASATVLKEQKLERQLSGIQREDASETKAGPFDGFAGEFASAMRSARAAAEVEAAPTAATAPGVTYELHGDSLLGDGVRSVLEFMKNDGINEARIVVEPPALGRVDVSLQASGTGVEAVFKVDNEALKQLLQQQLDILKTSLEAQGIHVSNLAVDIKNREDQKGRPDPYGGKGKARRADGVTDALGDEEPRLARIDLERGLLHWVA